MIRRSFRLVVPALLVSLLVSSAYAVVDDEAPAQPTLKPGDPAPPLRVGKWLKGEPVKELEKGKIYVIEMWATWCGPCLSSMPHVSMLQQKYKDKGVVVIGVDVLEEDGEAVERFMKKRGDRMGYAVASDDAPERPENGKMVTAWLKAAGMNGIPFSFLVDRQGKVAWMGHPLSMERPLGKLVEGTFDAAEQAKHEAKGDAIFEEFAAAMKAKDYDKALVELDRVCAFNPPMAGMYGLQRVVIYVMKGDYAGANALAAKQFEEAVRDGEDVRGVQLASVLLGAPDQSKADVALALKAATHSYEAKDKPGWQYGSILARAYAANKQFEKAMELQAKVVEQAPAQVKEQEEAALAEYRGKAGKK